MNQLLEMPIEMTLIGESDFGCDCRRPLARLQERPRSFHSQGKLVGMRRESEARGKGVRQMEKAQTGNRCQLAERDALRPPCIDVVAHL